MCNQANIIKQNQNIVIKKNDESSNTFLEIFSIMKKAKNAPNKAADAEIVEYNVEIFFSPISSIILFEYTSIMKLALNNFLIIVLKKY